MLTMMIAMVDMMKQTVMTKEKMQQNWMKSTAKTPAPHDSSLHCGERWEFVIQESNWMTKIDSGDWKKESKLLEEEIEKKKKVD